MRHQIKLRCTRIECLSCYQATLRCQSWGRISLGQAVRHASAYASESSTALQGRCQREDTVLARQRAHRCEWQYAMPCSIWYRYSCRSTHTPFKHCVLLTDTCAGPLKLASIRISDESIKDLTMHACRTCPHVAVTQLGVHLNNLTTACQPSNMVTRK